MPIPENREKFRCAVHRLADFPNQELVANPNVRLGNIRHVRRVTLERYQGVRAYDRQACLERGSARRPRAGIEGAKGALLGYGAAALARRSVPTLAALALGGWALKKWREDAVRIDYPGEAAPRVPPSKRVALLRSSEAVSSPSS